MNTLRLEVVGDPVIDKDDDAEKLKSTHVLGEREAYEYFGLAVDVGCRCGARSAHEPSRKLSGRIEARRFGQWTCFRLLFEAIESADVGLSAMDVKPNWHVVHGESRRRVFKLWKIGSDSGLIAGHSSSSPSVHLP